jgi:hypothetical protein
MDTSNAQKRAFARVTAVGGVALAPGQYGPDQFRRTLQRLCTADNALQAVAKSNRARTALRGQRRTTARPEAVTGKSQTSRSAGLLVSVPGRQLHNAANRLFNQDVPTGPNARRV